MEHVLSLNMRPVTFRVRGVLLTIPYKILVPSVMNRRHVCTPLRRSSSNGRARVAAGVVAT